MALHQKVFYAASFFLGGILLVSTIASWSSRLFVLLLAGGFIFVTLLFYRRYWIAFLSLALILGGVYYLGFDAGQTKNFTAPVGVPISATGLVTNVSPTERGQQLDVVLRDPWHGKIRMNVSQYPEFLYGDTIVFSGTARPIEAASQNYFSKEGIGATLSLPKTITIVERGGGALLKRYLFAFRDRVAASFRRVLPPLQAQFLTGITLGKSAGFSRAFKEQLSATGTTHLVALSGYNITIIAKYFFGLLVIFFSRRNAFIASIIAIILFVIMTGAEASVVRAGIMGIILLIADQSGRVPVFKNAVVISAFLMTLFNPKILAFDIGFQLSFAALLGIVYLEPALRRMVHASPEPGVLNWRGNLFTTMAAQLAVLPLLLSAFGFVSFISFLPNILLLAFIPLTMLFGLLIFIFSFLSIGFSALLAIPAQILLGYELSVIDLFSKIPVGIHIERISLIIIFAYYGVLLWVVIKKRPPVIPAYA